jgi:N utilization substance protein A
MNRQLLIFIDQISREKGLDRSVLIAALEEAFSSAVKKRLGTNLAIITQIDRSSGEISVLAEKRIASPVTNKVEEIEPAEAARIVPGAAVGDVIQVPQDMEYISRIAAQIAKQVILQKVREVERDSIHAGYKDRQGKLITGRVLHRDKGDILVELGKAEAILPKNQQIPHESFRIGDHIKAYLAEVQKSSRGPQIHLSRTDPQFLRCLFELEVPEIHDGIVEIKGVVREPGERAKVAVLSRQREVDPVGACVGVKGSRVQALVRELRGEKIDIIEWSEDIVTFVKNALSPAAIQEIRINKGQKHIMVIVPDEELSQAIGKKGQNVRLASRLIGWEIDIKSHQRLAEEAREQEDAAARQALAEALDLPIGLAGALVTAGYRTPTEVKAAGRETLLAIQGMSEETADDILARLSPKKKTTRPSGKK